jgi:hypothetical protein
MFDKLLDAVKNGDLVIDLQPYKDMYYMDDIMITAAENGHIQILEWALDNGEEWFPSLTYSAAQEGHLKVIKFAIENDYPLDEEILEAAVNNDGDGKEIIKYLHEHDMIDDEDNLIDMIIQAETFDKDLLEWAIKEGYSWTEDTIKVSTESNNLHAVQWAVSDGCPWDERTTVYAYEKSNEILEWALKNGCKWHPETMEKALNRGDIPTFYRIVKDGCPLNTSVIECAAKNGLLEVVIFIHDRGIELTPNVLLQAVSCDTEEISSKEIINYALDNGCKWHPECSLRATSNLSTLQYIIEKGCGWHPDTVWVAAEHGSLETIKWAISKGCPWSHQRLSQTARKNKEIVKYFKQHCHAMI